VNIKGELQQKKSAADDFGDFQIDLLKTIKMQHNLRADIFQCCRDADFPNPVYFLPDTDGKYL
jgi:hypothetical protein